MLAHQAGYGMLRASPLDFTLSLAALAVVVRPRSTVLLGALAALHCATIAMSLPEVYNHWYFAGLVSLALLAALLTTPAGFGAAARWSLVLLYAASGFHKVNRDFLDPAVSCANVLFSQLGVRVPVLPDPASLGVALPASIVLIELGLPVLLLVRRTRPAGVIAAVVFHLLMALAGYPRFSATGAALLLCFLPPNAVRWRDAIRFGWLAAAGGILALASGWTEPFFLWTTAGVLLTIGAAALRHLRESSAPDTVSSMPGLRGMGWAAIGPVLILLSALSPYLGLGTERAFAMYSNLRTEGGQSNHLLAPAALQPFGFQRNLVEIFQAPDERLESIAGKGLAIPFEELRARLSMPAPSGADSVPLIYLQGGARIEVTEPAADSRLRLPVSIWQRKLLRFRAVEASRPRSCGV